MGTLLDTTIFVQLERELMRTEAKEAKATVSWRLARELGTDEETAISAVTASELLHGVHRANPEHRARREAFVEAVLEIFPSMPFDLRSARVHSRLWAELTAAGADVGPYDSLIAAIALAHGWRLATANIRHFRRISGLDLVEVDLSSKRVGR